LSDVYLHFPCYQLGDESWSIEEASSKGRLFSEMEQLKEAGFLKHHTCSKNISAYDLALQTGQQLKNKCLSAGIDFKNIGALIYATCLPQNANIGSINKYKETRDIKYLIDYPASHLQADLEMDNAIVVGIDQQACTSMLGALRLAYMFLSTEQDMEHIICLTADRFPGDAVYEQSYNLISDGAAGILVSRNPGGYKLLATHQITNGAMAQASDDETVGHYFSYSSRLVRECVAKVNMCIQDLDYIVPQNTNRAAWQILSGLLPFDFSKVLMETLSEVGHCISGDNIINLKHLDDQNKFKSGDKILMLMAGFGLNWQCVIVEKV